VKPLRVQRPRRCAYLANNAGGVVGMHPHIICYHVLQVPHDAAETTFAAGRDMHLDSLTPEVVARLMVYVYVCKSQQNSMGIIDCAARQHVGCAATRCWSAARGAPPRQITCNG
jgi:hypothetical protein